MQKSEKKSIRIEPNQRVIGVTSMVGDYNSHVLFMDIDSDQINWYNVEAYAKKEKIDLHIFQSSTDGYHFVCYDIFKGSRGLHKLDSMQKELRTIADDPCDKKPYSTILELHAMGELYRDSEQLLFRVGPMNPELFYVPTNKIWRANVLRIGSKAEKKPPRYISSYLYSNFKRRISANHLTIYYNLGFPASFGEHYFEKGKVTFGDLCLCVYSTKNRLGVLTNEVSC